MFGLCQIKSRGVVNTSLDNDFNTSSLEPGSLSFLIGRESGCPMSLIKVDVAWIKVRRAAIGWVIYEDRREISWGCQRIWAQNAIQAEGIAIKEAMRRACGIGKLHVEIQSNCLQVIS
ncbi:hypothetical protein RND81_09G100400 [Saponaria officinalis]|uniref:RNase H type-1 domain-containing protein n=1 Tax=Saponaria officinalis TaxID=3572 RepID=A0AAW1IIY5_SAPOF